MQCSELRLVAAAIISAETGMVIWGALGPGRRDTFVAVSLCFVTDDAPSVILGFRQNLK
jgi:hypothetical protein